MNSVAGRAATRASEAAEKEKEDAAMTPMQRAALSIRSRQNRPETTGLKSGPVPVIVEPKPASRRAAATSVKTGDLSGRTDGRTGGSRTDGRTGNSSGRPLTAEKAFMPRKMNADELLDHYEQGKRDFALVDVENIRLVRVYLAGATFHNSNLRKVNFQGTDLAGADFGRANLGRANLRDSNLSKAYLSNADLQEADLRGADLRGAYLLNANLRGTNLCGANLTGAKLAPEQLAMAKTNWMTVKPNGKR
jgi:serine/threonine protein kinase, bacterial